HAMSPVGGVGINLAVADAVAAARILAAPLRDGTVSGRDLARVQARRWAPAALIQRVQRIVHNTVLEPLGVSAAARGPGSAPPATPRGVRIARASPTLRRALAYGIAIGPLPEHAPDYARRYK
ncbi:MAG TPA: FAD-dependent monooxygenase, partial [Vicinamibacterales bacterium]